uniref:hypothetical protein n=1 Tax=Pararhizobium sp. TaxID=1977563 RepID=UPI003D09F901
RLDLAMKAGQEIERRNQRTLASARAADQRRENQRRFDLQHGLDKERLSMQRQRLERADPRAQFALREEMAEKYGLKGLERQRYVMSGRLSKATKNNILDQRNALAKAAGLKAGTPEHQHFMLAGKPLEAGAGFKVPSGYMRDPNNPNGVVPIEGGPATKMSFADSAKVAMIDKSFQDLNEVRRMLGIDPNSKDKMGWVDQRRIGMLLGTGRSAQADRIMRMSIESILRAMTGAAAPQSEVDNYMRMFGPQSDDRAGTMAEKINRLESVLKGTVERAMRGRGGGTLTRQSEVPTLNDPSDIQRFGLKPGDEFRTPDGQLRRVR